MQFLMARIDNRKLILCLWVAVGICAMSAQSTAADESKPDAQPQRQSSLHWVVVQMLAMGTVLGRDLDRDYWGAASCSADD